MVQGWWNDLVDAVAGLPADFAFLLALPFFVVAVAFLPDLWHRVRRFGARPEDVPGRAARAERTTRPV
jgi:hypothetical protein